MIPTIIETITPVAAFCVDSHISKGIAEEIAFNAPYTNSKPKNPPTTQRMIDSIRNSAKIIYRLAPSAFLMPIMLVRSFTETNIILATLIIPTINAKRFINTKGQNRMSVGKVLIVQADEGITLAELKDEITGTLRSVRRLHPTEEDNFALNELSMINSVIDNVFGVVNVAGLFIGLFALIVGMISVANIMFVSVKERTSIIGIKKALGAKRYMILAEFLIESIILCVVGGFFGLLFVYGALKAISSAIPFDMWLSTQNAATGVIVSIIVGIIAGFIPASQASRMDPVEAMRS